MDDEEEIVLQLEDNALAHSPNSNHSLTVRRADGRIDRAKEEWLGDAYTLECLTGDARLERFYIDGYVRQLWQYELSEPAIEVGGRRHDIPARDVILAQRFGAVEGDVRERTRHPS